MELRVLFVDDDENVLSSMQRMLHNKKNEWDIYLSNSGFDALNILENNSIDVIVVDIKMPLMNGAELLQKVKELYPDIIRIVLSGHTDEQVALQAIHSTHQFISKPCETEFLIKKIESTFSMRTFFQDKNILKILNAIDFIPSLPNIYLQIEKEMNSPDFSLHKIGELISQDISLTAKVLQIVNSAFFGLSRKISNPTEAVTFLGANIIKSLILYIKIFSSFKMPEENQNFINNIWLHSIKVADISKKISKYYTKNISISEGAYIASILHDIGKIVLLQIPNYYNDIIELISVEKISYQEAEYRLFHTSHSEVGAYLLGIWGLPEEIVEAVAYHHKPSKTENDEFTILTFVHIANSLSFFPEFDLKYLEDLKIISDIDKWVKIVQNN